MNTEEILNIGIQAGYNVELAKKFGIVTAIVLNRLVFLHKNNKRKDGFTWQTAKDWESHTGLSDYQVKKALDKLVELNIIEMKNTYIIGTQIKCRHQRFILKSDFQETSKSGTQETSKSESKVSLRPVNSIEHSIEHSINGTKVPLAKASEFGNQQINEMFDIWNEMFGYKPKNSAENRRAVYNMLRAKDKGKEWLLNTMKILKESQKDRYAGRDVKGVAGFAELSYSYDKIWKWGSDKHQEMSKNITNIEI